MKQLRISALGVVVVVLVAMLGIWALAVSDGDREKSLEAKLKGSEEVPAVVTKAQGEFKAKISMDERSFDYELSYDDLKGKVTQGHIHVGQKGVNGGIAVFLCDSEFIQGTPGTPRCPDSGTVRGTISASEVIGPKEQGIGRGEFEELLRAIRKGETYVNVHTTSFPDGEIRGQIKFKKDDDHKDGDRKDDDHKDDGHKDDDHKDWDRKDDDRKDHDRKDWDRKDHDWKDDDRKDHDRKDHDRKDWDRKDDDRKDHDRKDWDRKDHDRKDWDRKDHDRKDDDRKDHDRKDGDRKDDDRKYDHYRR
jgi:CHRD domain